MLRARLEVFMKSSVLLGILVVGGLGCNNEKVDPFKPVAECMGATVTPFSGDRQLVIASLAIADAGQGFDLDLDGKVDNRLSALSALANKDIETSFLKSHDIIIPMELFGYSGQSESACIKAAFYIGEFNKDADGDGKNTT